MAFIHFFVHEKKKDANFCFPSKAFAAAEFETKTTKATTKAATKATKATTHVSMRADRRGCAGAAGASSLCGCASSFVQAIVARGKKNNL